uniref:Glycerophosphodiester phosphodiesterase 1 n=1 Tax=Leptobrachium leishanense TaxID=445787 RepID=A0A8C5QIB7_9ANUR
MLWGESLLVSFSGLFVVLLLLSRSPLLSSSLTCALFLLLAAVRFPPLPSSRTLQVLKPRGRVSAIAHRGGGHDAPENTLAAIRTEVQAQPTPEAGEVRGNQEWIPGCLDTSPDSGKSRTGTRFWKGNSTLLALPPASSTTAPHAAKNGATGVELDVEFTSDGVPILMHDDTVDRTTDGTGKLSDLTYDDIRRLNAAAKHRLSNEFPDEKVPTLDEAVRECLHHNLIIYFDVKGHADEAADALRKLYASYSHLYNSSIVCSFQPSVIYKMRQADPNVVTALTHRPWSLSHFGDGKKKFDSFLKHYWHMFLDVLLDWGQHNILWNFCGVSAFLMQKNYISGNYVEQWNLRGIEVVAWTVNNASEKLYYENILHSNYITDSIVEDCDPHY